MPLSGEKAVEQANIVKQYADAEREPLDEIRRYWRGRQGLPAVIPTNAPSEVREMARTARVNVCAIVVESLVQSTYVDGFRAKEDRENNEVWKTWQANRMDARQAGIHRAAYAYGTSYAIVLPGKPEPVIRGASPRALTAMYGEDPDWPMWALERLGNGSWRLYDDEAVYYLSLGEKKRGKSDGEFEFIESREHGLGVTPVIRYVDEDDLDWDDEPEPGPQLRGRSRRRTELPPRGQVAPLVPVQDQIDMTTFGLLVAQHYSAFRQRWAIGWVAPSEKELLEKMLAESEEESPDTVAAAAAAAKSARMQAGASQFWTFDENPEDMKIGEFSETNLKGYIESREASLRHAATLSQTPVHELTGTLINMAAEALAAAEAGKDRKVGERQTGVGESHEQTFSLVGRIKGIEVPGDAQVVWRDTSARSFAATVDALGKMVQMLGIPPEELWERVPNATQQDVERWKAAAQRGDSFAMLRDMLERQSTPSDGNGAVPAGVA